MDKNKVRYQVDIVLNGNTKYTRSYENVNAAEFINSNSNFLQLAWIRDDGTTLYELINSSAIQECTITECLIEANKVKT